jgi:hypothetical protein
MAGPYDYTVNIPQPPAQNFLQSLMGIRQLQQMEEQSAISQQQAAIQQQNAAFQQQMQPLEKQRLEAGIAAQRANTAQSMASRDVALENLRQNKATFAEQEEIKKQEKLLREDVMAVVKDPTLATKERLGDISFRTAIFSPKSYEPFQKMFEDLPRAGKVLENTASDIIFAVQSGQPKVAVASVNKQLEAAQNSLQINPDDKEAKATVSLLEGVKSQMDEEKYGEAMVSASIFLKNQNSRKWNAVTGDLQELGKATKAVAEAAGEKTKSELQEAQARLAKADAELKELKTTGKLDAEEIIKQETARRENFISQPFVRDYPVRRDAYNIITTADETPIGDSSKVVAFIKLQDPRSVVSVTEKGQITSTTPIASAQSLIAKFNNDGLLDAKTRRDINSQSKKIFDSTKFDFDQFKKRETVIAKHYGLNPENIVSAFDVEERQPTGPVTGPTGAPGLPISTGNIPVAPTGGTIDLGGGNTATFKLKK